jgi:hypothetical protein
MSIKRQFIMGEENKPVAVILPIEDYQKVQGLLEDDPSSKLALMKEAAKDPLFLQDLKETMTDFAHADREWWEENE